MTVDVFQLAVLLILALGLGVLIPVALELKRFARVSRKHVERTAPKLDRLVDDVQVSAKELKKVSEIFRGQETDLVRIRDSISRAVDSFEKVEKGLRLGSAVGAAVAPAIAAFLASLNEQEDAESSEGQHAMAQQASEQHRRAEPTRDSEPRVKNFTELS